MPLAAPRKHARVPGLPVTRPRSLTGPASALLAGKSLKTLMSKGILQVHPPISATVPAVEYPPQW